MNSQSRSVNVPDDCRDSSSHQIIMPVLFKILLYLALVTIQSGMLCAQTPVTIDILPETRLSLKESKHYFLADVIDSRKEKGKSLGRVVRYTQSQPLSLQKNLENVAFDFWDYSLTVRENNQIPVVARIKVFGINETREAPGRIKGESFIYVEFVWYRTREELLLTSYRAKGNYTRPESSPTYEEFLGKMLGDAMIYFDKWMTLNNGKNPALVRGVRLVIENDYQAPKADTVFYHPSKPLRYSDFKAEPKSGRYAAMVFTSISYEGNSRVDNNLLEVIVKLKVYVVKSMSWMRPESRTPQVLKHEQTHFDIARISAERFKKKLDKLELTVSDHDSQIQYQFLESYREMNHLQKAYDRDTRHGLNPEEQRRWEEMVKNELEGGPAVKPAD